MQQPLPSPRVLRKPFGPINHTARELSLMLAASTALLAGRAPALSGDELAEAGQLLEALDRDPVDIPYAPPFDDDDEPDTERPGRDVDELFDQLRDLRADRRAS